MQRKKLNKIGLEKGRYKILGLYGHRKEFELYFIELGSYSLI